MFSNFNKTFHRGLEFSDVKLSSLCPCNTCKNVTDKNRSEELVTKYCSNCFELTIWLMNCISKLKEYENNDKKL